MDPMDRGIYQWKTQYVSPVLKTRKSKNKANPFIPNKSKVKSSCYIYKVRHSKWLTKESLINEFLSYTNIPNINTYNNRDIIAQTLVNELSAIVEKIVSEKTHN